jgi:hypothetical protein
MEIDSGNYMKKIESNLPSFLVLMHLYLLLRFQHSVNCTTEIGTFELYNDNIKALKLLQTAFGIFTQHSPP